MQGCPVDKVDTTPDAYLASLPGEVDRDGLETMLMQAHDLTPQDGGTPG
jgi:hypothetical protein